MNVLLVSTYELGHQPIHVAAPAATLGNAGHDVRAVDLAVDSLADSDLGWSDVVAISVPMHTAKRLADSLTGEIKEAFPALPVAQFGLYAGVGRDTTAADALIEGEYEPALLSWVESSRSEVVELDTRHVGRSDLALPDRSGLPGLDRYARLEHNGQSKVAAAVEASHGCRHRCRHCPIPAVYDGRMRVVPAEIVLADIAQLVSAGAEHITFSDPDFLNAPAHSLPIIEQAHEAHPDVTFDVTVKVEHILKHPSIWERLAACNLLFVVSAFESVDAGTLDILDKGHNTDDMARAVKIVRSAGIHIRPTWLPFVPWTTAEDVVEMFRFIGDNGLVGSTDPVQLAIKLLVPEGSLLEDHAAMKPFLTGYDPSGLTWQWEFADPAAAQLQKELEVIAADASECGAEVETTLDKMRSTVNRLTDSDIDWAGAEFVATPRLTESWFCCAEPTSSQTAGLQIGRS